MGKRLYALVYRPQLWLLLLAAGLLTAGIVQRTTPVTYQSMRGAVRWAAPHPQATLPRVLGDRERVVRDMTLDCTKAQCIALTFDDGPDKRTTPKVLDILEREHVPAAFFVMGKHIAGNQSLLRRMYSDGFEVGNHSWSHSDFTKLSTAQMHAEIERTQAAIHAAGLPYPTLFRPPYGAVNDTVRANVGMTFMFWNEDPVDWAAKKPEEVISAVEAAAHPGGVVIMHDVHQNTVDALPEVIRRLRAKGYQFSTPSHMLDILPGQHGDFYGRPPH